MQGLWQWVSLSGSLSHRNIEAQNNGVFDKIVCREIEVVDQDGNQAISLGSNERGNGVIVYDNQGKTAFVLHSSEKRDNTLFIFDKQGKAAISLEPVLKKKDTIQELMFTFNHWSSAY